MEANPVLIQPSGDGAPRVVAGAKEKNQAHCDERNRRNQYRAMGFEEAGRRRRGQCEKAFPGERGDGESHETRDAGETRISASARDEQWPCPLVMPVPGTILIAPPLLLLARPDLLFRTGGAIHLALTPVNFSFPPAPSVSALQDVPSSASVQSCGPMVACSRNIESR